MSQDGGQAGQPEDPEDVQSFIRSLLSTLDVFRSDSQIQMVPERLPSQDVTAGEPQAQAAQPSPSISEPATVEMQEIYRDKFEVKVQKSIPTTTKSAMLSRKASVDSRKQLNFALTKSELEPITPSAGDALASTDDKVIVEQFIRDMISNIEFDKTEKDAKDVAVKSEKSFVRPKVRSKSDIKMEKEDRESTHRFIRGLLENINVYKEVMKKRTKEIGYVDEFGERFDYYPDYEEYLAEKSEEEEEAAYELPRNKGIQREESLRSACYKCVCMLNGDIYEGEYAQGKRHGRGLYCFKNGARYDGFWKKGLKHGKGQFLYPDGSRYIGNWKRDLKHGQGTYYYINGDIYDGGWYKGVRHGLGTYTYKSRNVTHYGTWKYGRMDGPGVLNYPYYKYHGNFERNLPKGPGCFVFDGKYMQHGFYVHEKDPTVGLQMDPDMEFAQTEGRIESIDQYKDIAAGLVPVWKARQLTKYTADLLPPEPVPLLVKESQESMVDIIEYLQQQYAGGRPVLGRPGIGRRCW